MSAAGFRPNEVLGKLQEGDDRAVPLAGGLAVGNRVAPDAELALEGGGQPARSASSPVTRASAPATRIARRTSGRAKNRSPRTWNGMPAAPRAPRSPATGR